MDCHAQLEICVRFPSAVYLFSIFLVAARALVLYWGGGHSSTAAQSAQMLAHSTFGWLCTSLMQVDCFEHVPVLWHHGVFHASQNPLLSLLASATYPIPAGLLNWTTLVIGLRIWAWHVFCIESHSLRILSAGVQGAHAHIPTSVCASMSPRNASHLLL